MNAIDKETEYLFLDKELQQVVRDAELGRRLADKLVRVVTKEGGEEIWVFIHIEIQGFYEVEFDKRMYVYNYRLFDRYDRPICSLVVLADERKRWRPQRFQYRIWGCEASLTFPVVKLLDYEGRETELETSTNPFALLVLACIKALTTRKQPESRFQWKFHIYQLLYERGYATEDILELTRFIDWMMVLPKELEQRFEDAITQYEEEQRMKYITSHERIGMEKGRQQGLQQGLRQGLQEGLQQGRTLGMLENSRDDILEILQLRFQEDAVTLEPEIKAMQNLSLLKQLHRKAIQVESLDAFQHILNDLKNRAGQRP